MEDWLHMQAEIALEGKQHEDVARPQATALLGKLLLVIVGRCCGLVVLCIVIIIMFFLLHAVIFSAVHLRYVLMISIDGILVSHTVFVRFGVSKASVSRASPFCDAISSQSRDATCDYRVFSERGHLTCDNTGGVMLIKVLS